MMFNKSNVVTFSKGQALLDLPNKQIFDLWCTYPAVKTCEWFKSLPTHSPTNPINRAVAFLNHYKNQGPSQYTTAKICPGIKNILLKSIVVHAPCDMDICVTNEVNPEGEYFPIVLASDVRLNSLPIATTTHCKEQFTSSKSKVFTDHVNLKIDTRIVLQSKNINPIFMQPIYHNPNAPWRVAPAAFDADNRNFSTIIFNAFLPIDTKPFSIKKGDALFYIYFDEPINLVDKEYPTTSMFKDKFFKPGTSVIK